MMKKILNKITAVGMMSLMFLAPLSSSALAAPKGGAHKPPRQVHQIHRHTPKVVVHHVKHAPRHVVRHAPGHHYDRDDRDISLGKVILGVVLGKVVANAVDY